VGEVLLIRVAERSEHRAEDDQGDCEQADAQAEDDDALDRRFEIHERSPSRVPFRRILALFGADDKC